MDEFDIKITAVEDVIIPQEQPLWRSLPHQIIGNPLEQRVQIVVNNAVVNAVHAHAFSSLDEIGGVLVGKVTVWESQIFVEIKVSIAGNMERAGPARVTFSADSWMELLQIQEQEYPDLTIVGWYHSHPRMDIFLSGLDLEIHKNFFKEPWQIALVVNGQDQRLGFFVWEKQEIQTVNGFYALDAPRNALYHPKSGYFNYSFEIQSERPLPPLSWREWAVMALFIIIIYLVPYILRRLSRRRSS